MPNHGFSYWDTFQQTCPIPPTVGSTQIQLGYKSASTRALMGVEENVFFAMTGTVYSRLWSPSNIQKGKRMCTDANCPASVTQFSTH